MDCNPSIFIFRNPAPPSTRTIIFRLYSVASCWPMGLRRENQGSRENLQWTQFHGGLPLSIRVVLHVPAQQLSLKLSKTIGAHCLRQAFNICSNIFPICLHSCIICSKISHTSDLFSSVSQHCKEHTSNCFPNIKVPDLKLIQFYLKSPTQ